MAAFFDLNPLPRRGCGDGGQSASPVLSQLLFARRQPRDRFARLIDDLSRPVEDRKLASLWTCGLTPWNHPGR